MKVSYNWLQEYIEDKLPTVETVVEALTMHSFEIEGVEAIPSKDSVARSTEGGFRDAGEDKILDVKVLPNHSHDCLSHYGIASEIASVLNLRRKELLPPATLPTSEKIKLTLDSKSVNRAMMILITGVRSKESPEWLKSKLNILGHKSINSIVDITNYLTYSFGQPMHAFDAGKILQNKDGAYEIHIRDAKDEEKITLLDGKEYNLDSGMMVIADTDKALDVAGVMGGKESGVSSETKNIILSLSGFDSVSIRKTAKKLGIRTDASHRFENDISPSLVDRVLPYALNLIKELAGGEVVGGIDLYPVPQKPTEVSFTLDKVEKVLGTKLDRQNVLMLLARQNIFTAQDGDKITATIPLERLDLRLPEDIAEEIGRIYGYENISPVELKLESPKEVSQEVFVSQTIRNVLIKNGFSEIYNYAFTDSGEVEVENPLAGDKKFLRSNLAKGMEKSLEENSKFLDLLAIEDVKIFEIGKVFREKGETLNLAIGVMYPKSKKSIPADEGVAEAIRKVEESLGVSLGDISIVGGVAEIDLIRLIDERDTPETYPADLWNVEEKNILYQPISPYPFAVRDVAVFVPNEIPRESVENFIKGHLIPVVVRFSMFDKFVKGDKTSYGFRLVFQSSEKTLTDEEINSVMNPIYETLKSQPNFEIR